MVSRALFIATVLVSLLAAPPVMAQGRDRTALATLAAERALTYQAERARAEARAAQLGIPVRREFPDGRVMELQRLEGNRPLYYITENLNAADTVSADEVWPGGGAGLGLTGAGQTLGIWDGGNVRGTHQELGGRVNDMDGGSTLSDHATHVSGTMIGLGVNAAATGMAFGASGLRAWDFNNDESEMTAEQGAISPVRVSNHSYGFISGWIFNPFGDGRWAWYGDTSVDPDEDWIFGFYESNAQSWDQIAYDAPDYLMVKSAGNDRNDFDPDLQPQPPPWPQHWHFNGVTFVLSSDSHPGDDMGNGSQPVGYDTIGGGSASAKNILTVGAINDIPGGYTQPGDVVQSSFSGWGPTDDGRIKPDVVANGVSLFSSVATNDTAYANFSGTSMSSPNTSGVVGLLNEHLESLLGFPLRASSLKALLVHTADEAGPAAGPDFMNGWGLVNAESAASVISAHAAALNTSHIEEVSLADGTVEVFQYQSDGLQPFRVTASWTDVPGMPPSPPSVDPPALMLVNDIDIRVVDPNGMVHEPWVLDPLNPASAAVAGDNFRDTVEQVHIAAPVAGTYTVEVTHKGSLVSASVPPAVPAVQVVSLVVTGNLDQAPGGPPVIVSTGATSATVGVAYHYDADDTVSAAGAAPIMFSLLSGPAGMSVSSGGLVTWTPAAGQEGQQLVEIQAQNSFGADVESYTINVVDPQAPIGYWSFDEGSGTVAGDGSGQGRDGTVVGATWIGGQVGASALSFDNVNDAVTLPAGAVPAQFSIAAWINPLSSVNDPVFAIMQPSTANPNVQFKLRPGNVLLLLARFSGGYGIWQSAANAVTLGAWQHVAVTFDATSSSNDPVLYVDGVAVAVTEARAPSGTLLTGATGWTIGNQPNLATSFDGGIDEVYVYDRVLSAAEVTALATPPGGNASPVLAPVGPRQVDEGQSLNFTLTATDADAGDTLTFTGTNLPPGSSLTDNGFNGTEWTATFDWPNAGPAGSYPNVHFEVSDGNGGVDSEDITIMVNPVNASPVLAPVGPRQVDEGQSLNFTLTATDADAGDTLTFTGTNLPPGSSLTDNGFNGTEWTATFDWPNAGPAGSYPNVHFEVSDGNGGVDSEDITITVNPVNASPVLAPVGPRQVDEGQSLNFTLTATDADAGDTLTFTGTNLPPGSSLTDNGFNGTEWTATFDWPNAGPAGSYLNVHFEVSDGNGGVDSEDITVTVNPVGGGGPLGYWSFDEGSGTVAGDGSGQGRDGTVVGATWIGGQVGASALSFDNVNDAVTLPAGAVPAQFSIAAWINPLSSVNDPVFAIMQPSTANPNVQFKLRPGNVLLLLARFSGGYGIWQSAANAVTLGAWQHVAVTFDATSSSNDPVLYVDGVAVAVTEARAPSGTLLTGATGWTIGNQPNLATSFDGGIDEVYVYDRVLSAAEVAALAGL